MFEEKLRKYFTEFLNVVSLKNGDQSVKGFIDIYKNIYTISVDTKVISKIVELMIFPVIVSFARENNYKMVLASHQNHYPDITFIDKISGEKIALDLKSTYRVDKNKVNGITLGAFTGYFRNRKSAKNITFPYQEYSQHLVLGVIYTKSDLYRLEGVISGLGLEITKRTRDKLLEFTTNQSQEIFEDIMLNIKGIDTKIDKQRLFEELQNCIIDEKNIYNIENLDNIYSVVRDFEFFVQEKWKIAIDRPGSGNTKNIGSITNISDLKNGLSTFSKLKNGKEIFDDFWSFYLTKDMAKSIDMEQSPYNNLDSYLKFKNIHND